MCERERKDEMVCSVARYVYGELATVLETFIHMLKIFNVRKKYTFSMLPYRLPSSKARLYSRCFPSSQPLPLLHLASEPPNPTYLEDNRAIGTRDKPDLTRDSSTILNSRRMVSSKHTVNGQVAIEVR